MNIVMIAASGVIIILASLYFNASSVSLRKQSQALSQSVYAEAQASELLEFFAAMSSNEALTFLRKNPLNRDFPAPSPASPFTPYKMCSHINIVDRESGKIINADPLADLPEDSPLVVEKTKGKPNRFYQVQVVDAETLSLKPNYCKQEPGTFTLASNERLLVTVGMTWVPLNTRPDELPRRVVLTTLLGRL